MSQPTSRTDRPTRGRVAWRCRRGMKELDVLLERFVRRGLDSLNESELETLEALLEEQDPDLFYWLTGREMPPEGPYVALIERMRAFTID